MFDIVIRGGVVVDSTGAPGQRRDVGILGERVSAIGELEETEAARVIDARGKVVSPGFVDPHSHSDWTIHPNRDANSTIRQGVTTEIVGNCGISNALSASFRERRLRPGFSRMAIRNRRPGARSRTISPMCSRKERHGTLLSSLATVRCASLQVLGREGRLTTNSPR